MDINNAQNIDSDITDSFSNFQLFGIGTPSKKQIERRMERASKKVVREEKRFDAKIERQKLPLGQRVLNVVNKVNPALAIMRSAALVGIRMNVFGIARKLYPAFLNESEIKARNINPRYAEIARRTWNERVKKIWLGFGGRSLSFEDMVKKGFDKPIFNTKKIRQAKESGKFNFTGLTDNESSSFSESQEPMSDEYMADLFSDEEIINAVENLPEHSNVAGVDDAAIAAYISTGLTILGTIANVLTSLKGNPYNSGSPQAQYSIEDDYAAQQGGYINPTAQEVAAGDEILKKQAKSASITNSVISAILIGGLFFAAIAVAIKSRKE